VSSAVETWVAPLSFQSSCPEPSYSLPGDLEECLALSEDFLERQCVNSSETKENYVGIVRKPGCFLQTPGRINWESGFMAPYHAVRLPLTACLSCSGAGLGKREGLQETSGKQGGFNSLSLLTVLMPLRSLYTFALCALSRLRPRDAEGNLPPLQPPSPPNHH